MNTIEETVTRLVADVDWTDECEVILHVRKRTNRYTPDQARRIAAALTRSAEDAERAAASVVRPVAPAGIDLLGSLQASIDRARGQAREVAAEIGAMVAEGDHLSPDCRAGKHPLHQDDAWDNAADVEVPCECPCHTAAKGTAA